ncbi:Flp family type IVb pilin [Consotaella aegiceratis]|uniref:Flp family type IVb pilin n=1 Tax=Consotaella aegiceratis TaxID=3097961 RepID=UPI002F3E2521
MFNRVRQLYRKSDGVTAVEYALIAALVSVAVLALSPVAEALTPHFARISDELAKIVSDDS